MRWLFPHRLGPVVQEHPRPDRPAEVQVGGCAGWPRVGAGDGLVLRARQQQWRAHAASSPPSASSSPPRRHYTAGTKCWPPGGVQCSTCRESVGYPPFCSTSVDPFLPNYPAGYYPGASCLLPLSSRVLECRAMPAARHRLGGSTRRRRPALQQRTPTAPACAGPQVNTPNNNC